MYHNSYLKNTTRERIISANASTPAPLKVLLNRAYTETMTCIRTNEDKTDKITRTMVAGKRARLAELNEQLRLLKWITDEGREAFEELGAE